MHKLSFKVRGLDCAEEVKALRHEILPLLKDETGLSFNLLQGKMTVDVTADGPEIERIHQAVRRTGMEAIPWEDHINAPAGQRPLLQRRLREVLCGWAAVALLAGYIYDSAAAPSSFHAVPYLLATVLAGAHFFPKALLALRYLRADMYLLMTVAIAGAMLLGEFFEAAMVAVLFSFAQILESWSVGRARHAIRSLLDLSPAVARYWCPHDQRYEEKPVAEIRVGSTISVRPGERFPLDGMVTTGETSVDQSPITGESRPVYKAPGDTVFAGTINLDGALEIRTTHAAGDTSIDRVIRMVEEAQSRRAPAEQWVDRFARYYTPIMMGIALAVAGLPPMFTTMAWSQSSYLALVLLLVACPCALVISTPVSIVAGLAAAARSGVLIKGGVFLELPARIRAIAFDKTGTLTTGQPEVQRVIPLDQRTETEVLALAAAVEQHSVHPIARAIVRHVGVIGIAPAPCESHTSLPGRGAEAKVGGVTYWIGNLRIARERSNPGDDLLRRIQHEEDAGNVVILLGTDHQVLALIALRDAIRPEAPHAIHELHALGIDHILLLTGDNACTARAIGNACGIQEVHAELLPEDKIAQVRALVARYGVVAMAGDGVNDAPAMAAANLGIAMGVVGTDAAIETADIALMNDDLTRLPWLISHARRTLAIITQNVTISLALKAAVFVLALMGWAGLWLAVAADMGASLLVIANALRLLNARA